MMAAAAESRECARGRVRTNESVVMAVERGTTIEVSSAVGHAKGRATETVGEECRSAAVARRWHGSYEREHAGGRPHVVVTVQPEE